MAIIIIKIRGHFRHIHKEAVWMGEQVIFFANILLGTQNLKNPQTQEVKIHGNTTIYKNLQIYFYEVWNNYRGIINILFWLDMTKLLYKCS